MHPSNPISNDLLVARVLAGRAFLVKTDGCVQYYSRLKRWLTSGNQGAVVFGRPRLGKTSATRWVLSMIQQAFGKVPFVEVPIRKQHLQNEGAFFQFLLKCCRHKHYNRGTVADKRDRFMEAMLSRARRSSIRMVIRVIQKAHRHTAKAFTATGVVLLWPTAYGKKITWARSPEKRESADSREWMAILAF